MLQDDSRDAWDTLRVIDFGFAQTFKPGEPCAYSCFVSEPACTVLHSTTQVRSVGRGPSAGTTGGSVDVNSRDVKPPGATTPYAPPEQLRSLQFQFEGAADDEDCILINGPAADSWSYGCVCYQMLTGHLPFLPDHAPAESAPEHVPEEVKCMWEEYESMLEAHQEWVSHCQCHAACVCVDVNQSTVMTILC